jgi:hypothetical protein
MKQEITVFQQPARMMDCAATRMKRRENGKTIASNIEFRMMKVFGTATRLENSNLRARMPVVAQATMFRLTGNSSLRIFVQYFSSY